MHHDHMGDSRVHATTPKKKEKLVLLTPTLELWLIYPCGNPAYKLVTFNNIDHAKGQSDSTVLGSDEANLLAETIMYGEKP